jgi:hypothetical protein
MNSVIFNLKNAYVCISIDNTEDAFTNILHSPISNKELSEAKLLKETFGVLYFMSLKMIATEGRHIQCQYFFCLASMS